MKVLQPPPHEAIAVLLMAVGVSTSCLAPQLVPVVVFDRVGEAGVLGVGGVGCWEQPLRPQPLWTNSLE